MLSPDPTVVPPGNTKPLLDVAPLLLPLELPLLLLLPELELALPLLLEAEPPELEPPLDDEAPPLELEVVPLELEVVPLEEPSVCPSWPSSAMTLLHELVFVDFWLMIETRFVAIETPRVTAVRQAAGFFDCAQLTGADGAELEGVVPAAPADPVVDPPVAEPLAGLRFTALGSTGLPLAST